MKEIILPFNEYWERFDWRSILRVEAPIGALVWGARCSSVSIEVYTYNSNACALQECGYRSMQLDAGQPVGLKVAGYDAYAISVELEDSEWESHIFIDIEDFIVELIIECPGEFLEKFQKWICDNLELGEEIPNNNGNPMRGGIPLVPPAMLFQMVDFTQRDYDVSESVSQNLPGHFDFIVKSSLTPATTVEELVERVNDDYSRHGGFREIDYDLLSEEALELLAEEEDCYIGLAGTYGYPDVRKKAFMGITGIWKEPYVEVIPTETAYEEISKILVENLGPEEEE